MKFRLGHFRRYHICIQNDQEGSLEAPANTKNHHLYSHHGKGQLLKENIILKEDKKSTVCCIIILFLDTLFDEKRCLIQNKAKLMWVQKGGILMAKILSMIA